MVDPPVTQVSQHSCIWYEQRGSAQLNSTHPGLSCGGCRASPPRRHVEPVSMSVYQRIRLHNNRSNVGLPSISSVCECEWRSTNTSKIHVHAILTCAQKLSFVCWADTEPCCGLVLSCLDQCVYVRMILMRSLCHRLLSVVCNACIVGKRYVLPENWLNQQIGLPDGYPVVPSRTLYNYSLISSKWGWLHPQILGLQIVAKNRFSYRHGYYWQSIGTYQRPP